MSTAKISELPDQESVASKLYDHHVFKHYEGLYKEHSRKNPLNAQIEETIRPNLTGAVLKGENRISLRSQSLFVIDDRFLSQFKDIDKMLDGDRNHSYTFFHLGDHLTGHPEIVHGGLLATLVDELACRLAFQNFESKKGMTANLNINYYKPCYTNSFVLIKSSVTSKAGRKCWVKCEVFLLELDKDEIDLNDVEAKVNLLCACDCLVIEPRQIEN